MTSADRVFSRLVLGAIAPVTLMLVGWWGSLGIVGDGPWVAWSAFAGPVLGVLLDATLLRRWVDSLYDLSIPALFGVSLFYSVGIYGIFMGMPVANLLVGLVGGFAVGRRAALRGEAADEAYGERRTACVGASALMGALCCATAWLGLSDPYTAGDLRGMLGLGFTPSSDLLRLLAVVGGVTLVGMEYLLTWAGARWAARVGAAA
jgi:hypothetical protein